MLKNTVKIIDYKGKKPKISEKAFIMDNVVIIGDVIVEDGANIWPNTTIRADLNKIYIGKNTNIQDNSVIHVDFNCPCVIKDNCTIGHGAILHSTYIEDNCLVGMGSILLNNSTMKKGSMLGAGSMLTSKITVPEKELWLGSPAKFFRNLKPEEIEYNNNSWKEYLELAKNIFINN